MYRDTIAAISTAVSESGIGIIRISGDDAFSIIDQIYRSKHKNKTLSHELSHTIHYGMIYDGEEIIDEVLVMIMRGPKSFTAEDTVEINCHGGVYAMKRILEVVLKNGARPAQPGEFTKRAFLNGRIDLSQAEAVIDVIQSKNELALKNSIRQLNGSVLEVISDIRKQIIYQIALIESALDDPEHFSLDEYPVKLSHGVKKWMGGIKKLIQSSENGRLIKEGIKTVITGKPNAGKSSLLNILTGEDSAIVTDIAGTTRDILTETVNLGGITLNIMDTAGIRPTEDPVEKIGVSRALKNIEDADLILYVVDSSTLFDENDEWIFQMIRGKKAIILLNKSDLPALTSEQLILDKMKDDFHENTELISVSFKNHSGINKLEECIQKMFFMGNLSFDDEVIITNVRQVDLLRNALSSLSQVERSIELNMPEDFLSIDLMDCYQYLGQITGEQVGEDLVNEIFNKFCMGK